MTVALLGTGLIGGSIGLALTASGMTVRGFDADAERAERARELGAIATVAGSIAEAVDGADVVIVAVPVGKVAAVVVDALDAGARAVTDVGSVKAAVIDAVRTARPELSSRYVGGHPMAGSEQDGLDGADADLFAGATWVLTPTTDTDPAAHTSIRGVIGRLGAEVIEIPPEQHDALVAVVSHVPQLAATTLMNVAVESDDQHALMMRLAAGGFRDMTRIAAGHPGIWPDICVANRDAILEALDAYRGSLDGVRALVASGDGDGLLDVLDRGRRARRSLPSGARVSGPLSELRVPVPDRPAVLAEVTTMAGRLGVNILDIEIAHSIEGEGGVLVLVVPTTGAAPFESELVGAGYHVARKDLT
ncbi:MAG: prephenate dehydrogenase [Acidimicrobiia bacterium]|nr:prephenate dehydrogenase [Acidimicrobiia bacterium]